MPDFLSRLAERATGMGLVAEPLIAPQYAPSAGPATVEPHPAGAAAPVQEVASPRADEPEARPRRARAPADPITGAAETFALSPHDSAELAAIATTPAPAPPSSPVAPPATDPPAAEQISAHATGVPMSAVREDGVPPRFVTSASEPQGIAQPHETVPVADETEAAFPSPSLAGAARQSTTALPHSRRVDHAEPAAPVIRVTIGRVDVRAEFPARPAAPAPVRRPPPTLSLEDYARERREGKR